MPSYEYECEEPSRGKTTLDSSVGESGTYKNVCSKKAFTVSSRTLLGSSNCPPDKSRVAKSMCSLNVWLTAWAFVDAKAVGAGGVHLDRVVVAGAATDGRGTARR